LTQSVKWKNRIQAQLALKKMPDLSAKQISMLRLSLQTRIQHITENVSTGLPWTKEQILKEYKELDELLGDC
jgi:hypothetical protein